MGFKSETIFDRSFKKTDRDFKKTVTKYSASMMLEKLIERTFVNESTEKIPDTYVSVIFV